MHRRTSFVTWRVSDLKASNAITSPHVRFLVRVGILRGLTLVKQNVAHRRVYEPIKQELCLREVKRVVNPRGCKLSLSVGQRTVFRERRRCPTWNGMLHRISINFYNRNIARETWQFATKLINVSGAIIHSCCCDKFVVCRRMSRSAFGFMRELLIQMQRVFFRMGLFVRPKNKPFLQVRRLVRNGYWSTFLLCWFILSDSVGWIISKAQKVEEKIILSIFVSNLKFKCDSCDHVIEK